MSYKNEENAANETKEAKETIENQEQSAKSLRALSLIQDSLCKGTCDLHIHTAASDGTEVSSYLIKKVISHNLQAFAITDYDTLQGVEVMQTLVYKLKSLGLHLPVFIPGIELTFGSAEEELGLFGYFPLGYSNDLNAFLQEQRNKREHRNREICHRLREQGIKIEYDEVLATSTYVVGRTHISNILSRKGYASTSREAFDNFLAKGKLAYVPFYGGCIKDGIKIVRKAGGVPVISYHSLKQFFDKSYDYARQRLSEFKACGLLGLQAIDGKANEEEIFRNIALADEVNLQVFSGSGYRGYMRPEVDVFRGEMDFSRYIKCANIK